ncbi:MAG: Excinuclease subunit domain protein [Parcubacteria group bacterium]|nr:Excinuclease subunit domain protein [Parcubacteria group bacterium]
MASNSYTVYLLECADGTFYTGVTTDMARRLREHNEGARGAKYTKARRPVKLVYQEVSASRSEAQKREYVLRILPRLEKKALISHTNP